MTPSKQTGDGSMSLDKRLNGRYPFCSCNLLYLYYNISRYKKQYKAP